MKASAQQLSVPRPGPLALVAIAAAGVAGLAVPLAQLTPNATLVILTGVVVAAPAAVAVRRGRFDPFEPVFVAALAYGAMFVVRPAAMLLGDDLSYARPTRTIDIADRFGYVQLLALVGALGLMAGYYVPAGRALAARLPRPPARIHADTAVIGGLGAGVLGMLLFGLFVVSAGGTDALRSLLAGRDVSQVSLYRNSSGYLYTGPFLLIPAALLLFATARTARNAGLTFVGAVFAMLLLAQAAPIGGRIAILPLVGSLAVFFYVSRGRRPRLATVVAIGLAALIASNVLLLSRNVDSPGYTHAFQRTFEDPLSIFRPITEQPDAEMAPVLAAAIETGSAKGGATRGMATVGETFVRPIPRVLWEGKPLAPRQEVIRDTWPVEYSAGIANPEFSVLLYFYLDFSFPGVFAGMFVIGLLLRALYAYLLAQPENLVAQLAFAALLPFIPILLRDSPTDTLVKLAFSAVPLLVICWLAADRPLRAPEALQPVIGEPAATPT